MANLIGYTLFNDCRVGEHIQHSYTYWAIDSVALKWSKAFGYNSGSWFEFPRVKTCTKHYKENLGWYISGFLLIGPLGLTIKKLAVDITCVLIHKLQIPSDFKGPDIFFPNCGKASQSSLRH